MCLAQGRDVGTVKVTMPIAWTTAMLAWGVQDFTKGYKKSGSYASAILNIKWGTDYLLKTVVGNTTQPGNLKLIWQVRGPSAGTPLCCDPEQVGLFNANRLRRAATSLIMYPHAVRGPALRVRPSLAWRPLLHPAERARCCIAW